LHRQADDPPLTWRSAADVAFSMPFTSRNLPRDKWRRADRFVLTGCRQPDGTRKLS
jgi:hypothetical protein